jgi:hypothetical protein
VRTPKYCDPRKGVDAITRAVVLILIMTCGTLALAQGPDRTGYTLLKAYLQLSDDQLQSLGEIQRQQDGDLQARYQQISNKQEQLRSLLGSGSNDSAQIGQLEIDIVNLRKELSIASRPYRQQSLTILTTDQLKLLPKLVYSLVLKRLASEAVSLHLLDDPNIIGAVVPYP